jgi:DNA-binding transcriptional ArsR family regulator
MIRRILDEGRPLREVARGFGISERTARKWLARYRAEGPSGLDNRSSCPKAIANRTAEYWIGVMEHLRREYRLTADEIASKLKLARSTVAAWLTRRGLGRLTALEPKEPPRRYQRQRPGQLIHLDIKKLVRFERVGHRITGDRRHPSVEELAMSAFMSRSMTPPGWPMSRCCQMRPAARPRPFWSEPCAGSERAGSRLSG